MNRIRLEDECLELLINNPAYCGDDTHALTARIVADRFEIDIPTDVISFMRSVDRSKQKVLKEHPTLDRRTKHKAKERAHREYYRED